MQKRKPKVCADSAAQGALTEPEIPASAAAHDLLEDEEGADQQHSVPRKTKQQLGGAGERRWSSVVNVVLVAFLMVVPPAFVVLGGSAGAPAVWIAAARDQLRRGSAHGSFLYARNAPDKLLGGLLADGHEHEHDEKSCRSRHESPTYRRNPGRRPSPHLVAKLRRHEELQRRCGPGTDSYDRAVQQLRAGKQSALAECKYVVSVSYRGLGNRMLAAASAFLYALLTDRVLLVDEMDGLFCEPFPGARWLLPRDSPLASHANFSASSAESYGNMRRSKVLTADIASGASATVQLPAFAFIYLEHDYNEDDKMFFCDDDQRLLSNIQWLVMRTDTYVVPGLFLVTSFMEELGMLFPERDAVFHHLGRYLFHPTNHVWGLVSRYYRAYLARAEQLVGIQVRAFHRLHAKSPYVLEQITSCVTKEKLLPEVLAAEEQEPVVPPAPGAKSKTVLITSLRPWYYERIKSMYWEQATATGEVVSVHQPSHEEWQHFGEKQHDTRAWAEMHLLSLCDVLVTSGWSTFGYVAQGLAGVTPWVMYRPPDNVTESPDPPCSRDVSMEPCFHSPPMYDCKLKRGADTGTMVPHVRHCEDVKWGLKLVDPKYVDIS